MASVLRASKISFEDKEQLISFRLYEKSATNAQTDGDG